MIETDFPTKEDLLRALADLRVRDLAFWLGIAPQRFAQPFGEAWSPADNVRHLIKSTTPVTRALKLPRVFLWALFGHAPDQSRRSAELVERYREALAEGGKAGRYSPASQMPPTDLAAWQRQLVSECQSAVEALGRAVYSWDETALDYYQLPHPLLGLLTVRQMVYFTLHHYEHHRAGVARRLAAATAA